MAFRGDAIFDCPLSRLFKNSRKGFHSEQTLAFCARRKGYHTYRLTGESSPVVYHIVEIESLTRGKGFMNDFWIHYDIARDFWRLRELGAEVNFLHYLIGMLILARKKPLARIPATLYALFK